MGSMKDLLADIPYELAFKGGTYVPARDHARLCGQLLKTYDVMKDKEWHSLREISVLIGGTEASISARIRDLRKPEYGSHSIERKHVKNGLFLYRMVS